MRSCLSSADSLSAVEALRRAFPLIASDRERVYTLEEGGAGMKAESHWNYTPIGEREVEERQMERLGKQVKSLRCRMLISVVEQERTRRN